jgi:proteasome accessory factor A
MRERIFGTECEYAPIYRSKESIRIARLNEEELLHHLKGLSGMLFSSLKHKDYPFAGEFLGNGGRFYVDRGGHPEYATPECRSVLDLVRYEKAGDRLVQGLAQMARQKMTRHRRAPELSIFKNNVDAYGTTYGGHENYLISPEAAENIHAIIPFMVTRQIFAGTGRVVTRREADTTAFQVSQRADFINHTFSDRTSEIRGIINTRKREIYRQGENRRLHIIVGDSNMSEIAIGLKIGATVLMLRLLEEGEITNLPTLSSPVKVLQSISRSWDNRFPLTDRRGRLTALEIQMICLEQVRRFFESHAPTPDEAHTLTLWEEVLHGLSRLKVSQENWVLEDDPCRLHRKIDWLTKLWLLSRQGQRPAPEVDDRWMRTLDLKYHDLDPDAGLYARCESMGLVDRLVDEDAILKAQGQPPENTRARLRGMIVKQTAAMNLDVKIDDWEKIDIRPKGQNAGGLHPFKQHKGVVHHLGIRLDDPFKAKDADIFKKIAEFAGVWGQE